MFVELFVELFSELLYMLTEAEKKKKFEIPLLT